ncbi:MAG TPA: methylmalonyl Co-A mutase-associated GTPase MeaB, partial [Candidatus Cloacimonas sp.]|nr:methylmalonyl Co-A mutase-associated GTPase MeaB [Candidatus Cloacimonas sp.]
MNKKRKPEWTPENSGKEFAGKIVTGTKNLKTKTVPALKEKNYSPKTLAKGVREGNRTLLAKAITLIESNAEKHFLPAQELIKELLP